MALDEAVGGSDNYGLGFRRFEHFAYRTQPEGMPSGLNDLDLAKPAGRAPPTDMRGTPGSSRTSAI